MAAKIAAEKDSIRLVIVGEVDHGKSTLVGRLLYETGSLPDGKVEAIQEVCRKRGRPMEWAFLLDSFQAERDQGITIDTTHIWFNTAKHQFVLVDAPGHHEFVRNMVTGAAQSDAALLLIDAAEGLRAQTRRHARLLGLLGVRQVVAAINKMDLVDFSQAQYNELAQQTRALLGEIGIDIAAIVPMAARDGDNVASRSANTIWYSGPTLLEALDRFTPPVRSDLQPLRIPVQDVYRIGDRRIIAGRVESGVIKVGDMVLFSPSNRRATVRSIESWPDKTPVMQATAGQAVGFTLEEQAFVERGAMVSHEQDAPVESNELCARIFWFGPKTLAIGQTLTLRIGTAQTRAQLIDIDRRIGTEEIERGGETIERNGIADIRLRTAEILPFDAHDQLPNTGRFALIDGHDVVGGGIVDLQDIPDQRRLLLRTATNLTAVDHTVPAGARAERNGHQGMVVWLTGLSGAGKSTLGMALERMLFERGYQTYVLDGDNVRRGLNADLRFSANDRTENIRRVAEAAALFADAGLIVITAFISPYRSGRDHARQAAGGHFSEVYVKASLAACEQRDPKGLYVKARAGQIAEFTGVSSSYEEPESADLVLDTEVMSIEESLRTLYNYVISRVKT
ncbi:MAG: adenylyl-sulfate kinase [Rhodospirillales bacterium]